MLNFTNPNYGVTNPASQEKLLSQLMGQGYQKAPPMLAPPSTAMQPRNRDPEREKAVQANKEKKSIQNAFDEIVETRNQTGKPFLSPIRRAQIFSKHGVPSQVVDRFNSTIDKMEAKAGYMDDPTQNVTRTLPDGSTSTTCESRQNLIDNPVIKSLSRKEALLNRVLDDNIKPEDLKPMERRLLGIKLKDTPTPTMKKMGNVWYQWDTGTEGWVDTGKKEDAPARTPTMKKMGNTWYQWDAKTEDWVDTGKKEKVGQILTQKDKIAFNKDVAAQTQERFKNAEYGYEITERDRLDTRAILLGAEVEEGKIGTAAEGKTRFLINGELVDTYGNPIKAVTSSTAPSAGAAPSIDTTPSAGTKEKPLRLPQFKKPQAMVKTVDELKAMMPRKNSAYKDTYPYGRTKTLNERLVGFTGQTQENQQADLERKGETAITSALRQTKFSDKSLYDRNNIKIQLKEVYPDMSEEQLAQAILDGKLLGE